MNEVVDYMRSCGYLVLVDEGGYLLDDQFVTSRAFLTLANQERMRANLSLFPLDLANPTYTRRNRQKGNLNLLINM